MSLVMRSKYDEELEDVDQKKSKPAKQRSKRNQSPCAHSPRTPKRKYKSVRNVDRSKNFWATYNNFILCNRSIELRITKLFSFQNTQYIVAFSENIFKDTYKESCCETQYMLYNIDACIYEICFVEHIIDLKLLMEYKVNASIIYGSKSSISHGIENMFQTIEYDTISLTDESLNVRKMAMVTAEKDDLVDCQNDRYIVPSVVSNRHRNIAMKISCVVVSLWVVYVSLRNYSHLFQ